MDKGIIEVWFMEINEALVQFGLDDKEREVYLLLLRQSWITALRLSRLTAISRPTLYRVIERLIKKGLVEIQVGDKTTFYNATDPQRLEILVHEQEQKAVSMRSAFAGLQEQIGHLSQLKNKETRVNFFHGKRGLQNMGWKLCSVKKTEVLIFGSSQWYGVLSEEYAEKWREEIVFNQVKIWELENPENFEIIIPNKETTWTKNIQYLNNYRHRQIPKEKLTISQDIYIHQDSIFFEGYSENELVGITIENKYFSRMMRQVFEHYWQEAEVVDKFG